MNNYVSELLCHFVGRGKKTDIERFQLLIDIIREQKLIASLEHPDSPKLSWSTNDNPDSIGEVFGKCDCVCFCDIPDESLTIHIQKYSQFGIGFKKSFLSKYGCRPVMYVPTNNAIVEISPTNTPKSPNDYFSYIRTISTYFSCVLAWLNKFMPFKTIYEQLLVNNPKMKECFSNYDQDVVDRVVKGQSYQMIYSNCIAWATQLAYVKKFDETLTEDDPNNYYMEREWRSIKNVQFHIDDIKRIYLPNRLYKEKFCEAFPEYIGSFYLFDQSN